MRFSIEDEGRAPEVILRRVGKSGVLTSHHRSVVLFSLAWLVGENGCRWFFEAGAGGTPVAWDTGKGDESHMSRAALSSHPCAHLRLCSFRLRMGNGFQ